MDADAYREQSRAMWEDAAALWEARREVFQRHAEPISMWMVDQARLQPGHVVLELAAGVGDTGLLAAELVQPGGKVIITDGSEGMVEAAKRRAQEVGAANVEIRQMDAEWIDLPTASVDAVLSRFGYMLLADPEASLRETRRVLRSGGRVTLAAWTAREDNQWMIAIDDGLVEVGAIDRAPPDAPGPMRFAEPGTIERLLEGAGFEDIVVEALDLTFEFPSTDAHWEHQTGMSKRQQDAVRSLSPADHTRLRDFVDERLRPFIRSDGSVAIPARTWVAAASA